MKALIQRVKHAQVTVENTIIGKIDQGILALIGIEKTDTYANAEKLLNKICHYRIFSDANNKMNLSVQDIHGGLLLVSQFTLVADTHKGMRPSFSSAADAELSQKLFNYLVEQARLTELPIQTGQFAANMQITLVNDGPVSFNLQC